MTAILYTGKGSAGPWACDDPNIVCDGWLGSDGAVKPGPTCDGVTHVRRPERSSLDYDMQDGRTLRHKDNP